MPWIAVRTLALTILLGGLSDLQADERTVNKSKPTPNRGPSITWVHEIETKNLPMPPRTLHCTFPSEAAGTHVGFCIYLPPAYDEQTDRRFPVIYNLHGNGGNEFTSLDSVRLLHAGIEDGRWPPMIMVLPNGGRGTFYKNSADGRFPIETVVMKELIPWIDSHYRTIAARSGRCIEGFSMGGRGSIRLAVKYPDVFCSVFCQAGNVPHLLEVFDAASGEERESLLLGSDRSRWEADDVYAVTRSNADRIRGQLRIRIACGTLDSGHIQTIRDYHQHLLDLGIDHTYEELEGLAHRRTEMINRLQANWFDYHVDSLRQARKATEATDR